MQYSDNKQRRKKLTGRTSQGDFSVDDGGRGGGECKGEREREREREERGALARVRFGGEWWGVARDSADLLSFRISNAPGLRRMHTAR